MARIATRIDSGTLAGSSLTAVEVHAQAVQVNACWPVHRSIEMTAAAGELVSPYSSTHQDPLLYCPSKAEAWQNGRQNEQKTVLLTMIWQLDDPLLRSAPFLFSSSNVVSSS
jgi:hypothetical protein